MLWVTGADLVSDVSCTVLIITRCKLKKKNDTFWSVAVFLAHITGSGFHFDIPGHPTACTDYSCITPREQF